MHVLTFVMIASLIMAFLFSDLNTNKKSKLKYLIIIFGILFIISALRGPNVGLDTKNYISNFELFKHEGLINSINNYTQEVGYIIINYLIGLFTDNAQWFLIFMSFIISYGFVKYIYCFSENVWASTFLYIVMVYSATMNISRQYMAISLVLIAMTYIWGNKAMPAVILLLIATQVHTTSIICLPLLLFLKIRIKKIHVFLSVIIEIGLLLFYRQAIQLFLLLVPKYNTYIDSEYFIKNSEVSLKLLIVYIFVALCALYITYQWNDNDAKNQQAFYFHTIIFCAFIVFYIMSGYFWMSSRIMPYFQVSMLVLLPSSINKLFNNYSKLRNLTYTFMILIYVYFGIKSFGADAHGLLPFQFINFKI